MTLNPTSLHKHLNNALDIEWLSEHVGSEVAPTYLRIKPHTSLVVAWAANPGSPGSERYGWARMLWPGAQAKAAKAVDHARKAGQRLTGCWLDDDILFQVGDLCADPKLSKHIRHAHLLDDVEVLRYNPLRRVVLATADTVYRISTHLQLPAETYRLISQAVNVPEMLSNSRDGLKSRAKRVGCGDLSNYAGTAGTSREHQLHAEAGRQLAQLHNVCLPAHGHRQACSGLKQLYAHATVLDHLDSELAQRVRTVAAHLPLVVGEPVTVHGDASPDQFLYSETGEVWMTDFDRLALGPAALDLGSYLSECSDAAGDAFLQGYEEQRPLPTESELRIARAHSLAARLLTPLRQAHSTWRSDITTRLDELEEVLL